MEITLTLPDELGAAPFGDPSRIAMEALAARAYQEGVLSAFQVRQMLGHQSRWETENFLGEHGVWPGTTVEDVRSDSRTLSRLLR